MPENITNNEILEAVNQGFGDLEMRFEKIDRRFDKVESRLKNLEQGQERIELKLANVAYRFELQELAGQVDHLEKKVADLSKV